MKKKLFCEYNAFFYWISCHKENLKRDLKNRKKTLSFSTTYSAEPLPVIIKGHRSFLLRNLEGVDQKLQINKIQNLKIAIKNLNGILILPGETFSFWEKVGKPTKKKGYLEGLVLSNGKPGESIGGGLCQLANMIHWLVLHTPLTVTELHHHTDSLFPDNNRRVPFGTGTSIFFKNVDYRFLNTTQQPIQLLLWLEEENLCAELRSTQKFPYKYKIVEENSHFEKEADAYYRISEIYQMEISRTDSNDTRKNLILQNHSKVLYDPSLIPQEEIWR